MFDPQMSLLKSYLEARLAEAQADPGNTGAWELAAGALGATRAKEADLAAAIDTRDAAALRSILEAWSSGRRHLPEQDREVLRRAMSAYRKSFKITRMDDETSLAGGPMSSGRRSGITGIVPPTRYPREVWDELARQGRLLRAQHGIFELPPE